MSLIQQATELTDGLKDLRSWRRAAERDAWFRDRALELRKAREDLEGPLEYLAAVDELRPPAPDDAALADKLTAARDAARSLARLVTDDPGSVASGNSAQKLRQAIVASSGSAIGLVSGHWRQTARELAPTGRSEVLSVLEQMPTYRPAVVRLRDLHQESSQLAAKAWPTRSELVRAIEIKVEADAVWQSLAGGEGIPSDVMSFLVACARDGAELAALTPRIREWIASRELAGSFRVRFSG